MDAKNASIVAQTASKNAAELAKTVTGDVTAKLDAYFVALESIHQDLVGRTTIGDTSLRPQASAAAVVEAPAPYVTAPAEPVTFDQAVANVLTVFPGSVGDQQPPASAVTDYDLLWKDLVQNPDNWWNNTGEGNTTIAGGSRPDFRSKVYKDKGGKPQPLYLVSRRFGRRAPDFVFQSFGIPIPALDTPPQVAPATQAVPSTPQPVGAPF